MDQLFKDPGTGKMVNILDHIKEVFETEASKGVAARKITLHVGCDSQNQGAFSNYVLVVAFRYEDNGVHFIYQRIKMKRYRELYNRLFKEAELSIELANFISANGIKVDKIDMDFNADKKHKSNILADTGKGWGESLGYEVNIKNDAGNKKDQNAAMVAVRAADSMLK